MSLTLNDVEKIAKLSRLALTYTEKTATLEKLNAVFEFIDFFADIFCHHFSFIDLTFAVIIFLRVSTSISSSTFASPRTNA